MKKIHHCFWSILFLWVAVCNVSAQEVALQGAPQSERKVIFRPLDILSTPQILNKAWAEEAIPLSIYSEKEKDLQKRLNEKTTDKILTYSPLEGKKDWTSVDFEDITPYTWKWIDFELPKEDGSLTKISLLRPNWWIKNLDADGIGKKVYLDMPELGSRGWATVKAIRINQLDTRFWEKARQGDCVSRPITGKFEHERTDLYHLYFGNNPEPLKVTGLHPIWSIDRNGWIGASDLEAGETVKTQTGTSILKSKIKIEGKHKVYNLEIYKDHTFLVSLDRILVHNACGDVLVEGINVFADDGAYKAFKKQMAHLAPGERVAEIMTKGGEIATAKGWELAEDVMKKNKGRTIYWDSTAKRYYSLDTQHGAFEVLDKKGKHLGEMDFRGIQSKEADAKGKHDINVK